MGAAFGEIVTSSFVNILRAAILTPALNAANLNNLTELVIPGTAIKYGNFISAAISFLIVAFALFMIIKGINKFKKKEEAAAAPPIPAGPTQEELLTQIRDLLQ